MSIRHLSQQLYTNTNRFNKEGSEYVEFANINPNATTIGLLGSWPLKNTDNYLLLSNVWAGSYSNYYDPEQRLYLNDNWLTTDKFQFSGDGRKLFLATKHSSGKGFHVYTLGEPWNLQNVISYANIDTTFGYSSGETLFTFSYDGTSLFFNDNYYTMDTPYDVANARVYYEPIGLLKASPSHDVDETGLNFYNMDAVGDNLGWFKAKIPNFPYELSNAAVASGFQLDALYQTSSSVTDMRWSPDGKWFYLTIPFGVYQLKVGTPWDVSTVYNPYAKNPHTINVDGPFALNNTGNLLFTSNKSNIYTTFLPQAWNISSAAGVANIRTRAHTYFANVLETRANVLNTPNLISYYSPVDIMLDIKRFHSTGNPPHIKGMSFNPEGNIMLILSGWAAESTSTAYHEQIHRYDLSRPWDLTTAVWQSNLFISDTNKDLNYGTWNPFNGATYGLAYLNDLKTSSDGKKIYLLNNNHSTIFVLNLANSWDISTAYFYDSLVLQDETGPATFEFSSDGSSIYYAGTQYNPDKITKIELNSPWVLTNNSITSTSISFGTAWNNIKGITLSPDESKIYVAGGTSTTFNTIGQFELDVPGDLSSANTLTYTLSTAGLGATLNGSAVNRTPSDIRFNKHGNVFYVNNPNYSASAVVTQSYTLSTPWDLSTASLWTEYTRPASFGYLNATTGGGEWYGPMFDDTGHKVTWVFDSTLAYSYAYNETAAVAWDISTVSSNGSSFVFVGGTNLFNNAIAAQTNTQDAKLGDNGNVLYVLNTRILESWQLNIPYDVTSITADSPSDFSTNFAGSNYLAGAQAFALNPAGNNLVTVHRNTGGTTRMKVTGWESKPGDKYPNFSNLYIGRKWDTTAPRTEMLPVQSGVGPHSVEFGDGGNILYINGGSGFYQWPIYNKDDATLDSILAGSQVFCSTQDFSDIMFNEDGKKLFVTRRGGSSAVQPRDMSKIIETFYLDRAWDLSSSSNAWGSRNSTISDDTYRNPPVVTTTKHGAKFVADGRMVVTNNMASTSPSPTNEDGFVMVNLKFPYNIDSANTDFMAKTFRNDQEFAGNVMNTLKLRTFLSSTNARIHTGHHTFIDNGNTMVFTWYPDGATVGNFRYIASLGMDIPYDFRTANISKVSNVYLPGDVVVIDSTYGEQQYGHRGMFFNNDGTKLWAYAPKTSANIASYTLSTPWDITSIGVDPSPQSLPYEFGSIIGGAYRTYNAMDWWLSPTGNVIYTCQKTVSGPSRITSWELATPYDFSTANKTGNIVLYGANINFNKFALTSYASSLTASPDGKIVVFQNQGASGNYTTLRLKTPYVISDSSVDSGLFNLTPELGTSTTITAVSSTMSKDGNHLYVLGGASNRGYIYHYNLTVPYEVESAVFANVLASGGTIATSWFTNCVKISEDGSKLFVVANSASRPAIQTINLDTPYDTSTASNGKSILRHMGFSPEVFEFTNDGNTIVICGTGTASTGQQIYQVKLRNPWDLSNAYTFDAVSVNPFALSAKDIKYHNGNIWFEERTPTYPIRSSRSFYRFPLDQYGGLNGNVNTDIFNSNIIAYPVHGLTFTVGTGAPFTVTNEGNLFILSLIEINDLHKANTLNYSPYFYSSIKELKYSTEPLRFTPDVDNSLSNNFIKSFNTVNQPFGMNIDTNNNVGPVFSPDGTKMLIKSSPGVKNRMYSFDLSTPWDLSSAVLKGNALLVSPSKTTSAVYDFTVTNDGKRIVYFDYTFKTLYCERMETPWDYSTAVSESYVVASETGIPLYSDTNLDKWVSLMAPVFSSNGKYLFILNQSGGSISRFEMTRPFDVSTINSGYGKYNIEFLTGLSNLPRSFSADQTNSHMMFINYDDNYIQSVKPKSGKNLKDITGTQSGPYTSAGHVQDPFGVFLKPGGNVLYIWDYYDQLRHYEIDGYNLSYEIGSNIYSIPLSKYLDGHAVYEGLTFSSDGSKIYIPASGNRTLPTRLYQLELGTPWDARTITSNNYVVLAPNALVNGSPTPGYYSSGIKISPDGTKIHIGMPATKYQQGKADVIYQYNLTEPGNIFANPAVDFVKDKFISVDAVGKDMYYNTRTVPWFNGPGVANWDFIDNGYKIVSNQYNYEQLVTIDLAVPYDITSNKLNYVFFDNTGFYTYTSMSIDDTGKNLILTTIGTNGQTLAARHFTMDEPYNLLTFRPANTITIGQFASNITMTSPSYNSKVSIRPDGKSLFTVRDRHIVEVDLGNINYA